MTPPGPLFPVAIGDYLHVRKEMRHIELHPLPSGRILFEKGPWGMSRRTKPDRIIQVYHFT
jgi:hypothetical protein